jgi:hypothetical protein
MWLPIQLIAEFGGRSITWLAVMAALGATAGLLLAAAVRGLRSRAVIGRLVAAGIVGALLGASIMRRFSLPEAVSFQVWRREVPLAWSAGGALVVAAAAAAFIRVRRVRKMPSGAPSAGIATGEEPR